MKLSWLCEKIKLTKLLPDASRKKRGIKSTKSEMKKENLQLTTYKYKILKPYASSCVLVF